MQTTGRWKLGLALALLTAIFWGSLPVTLKLTLTQIDPCTIVWYRFLVASTVLLVVLSSTGNLPTLRSLDGRGWLLIGVALLGLSLNFLLYALGLHYASPTATQVVMQLGPFFLLLGGLVIFKESFSGVQRIGAVLLIIGLLLFFNRKLPQLLNLRGGMGLGVALIVICTICWAAFGLAQKALTRRLSPQQILLLVYLGAMIVMTPFSKPMVVNHSSALVLATLAFACINTLIGYGAFAEALRHWDASRIGAILATAPLVTLTGMWIMEKFFPGLVEPEGLNALSAVGAMMVVGGAATAALASR